MLLGRLGQMEAETLQVGGWQTSWVCKPNGANAVPPFSVWETLPVGIS